MFMEKYTIFENPKTLEFLSDRKKDPFCSVTITYTVDPPAGGKALSFDQATEAFTIGRSEDMSLAGDTYIDYLVTLKAIVSGVINRAGVVGFTAPSYFKFLLRIRNPCTQSKFVSMWSPTPSPSYNTYKLFSYSPTDPMWITEH